MTKEEILNKVQEIVSEQLDVDAAESIKTIQDVVDHVAKQLEAND